MAGPIGPRWSEERFSESLHESRTDEVARVFPCHHLSTQFFDWFKVPEHFYFRDTIVNYPWVQFGFKHGRPQRFGWVKSWTRWGFHRYATARGLYCKEQLPFHFPMQSMSPTSSWHSRWHVLREGVNGETVRSTTDLDKGVAGPESWTAGRGGAGSRRKKVWYGRLKGRLNLLASTLLSSALVELHALFNNFFFCFSKTASSWLGSVSGFRFLPFFFCLLLLTTPHSLNNRYCVDPHCMSVCDQVLHELMCSLEMLHIKCRLMLEVVAHMVYWVSCFI